MLPCPYFHVTVTVPEELRDALRANQRDGYALLMKAAADAIVELASDRRYVGATVGVLAVLHTWGHRRICSKSYAKTITALNQRIAEASQIRSFSGRVASGVKISEKPVHKPVHKLLSVPKLHQLIAGRSLECVLERILR